VGFAIPEKWNKQENNADRSPPACAKGSHNEDIKRGYHESQFTQAHLRQWQKNSHVKTA
jgi:hypothetical protein